MANDKDKIYEKIFFLAEKIINLSLLAVRGYCERYHVDVEDWRKWYRGISKAIKEVKVVGGPNEEAQESSEETCLQESEETEIPRIVISTTDIKKKVKSVIESVINAYIRRQ